MCVIVVILNIKEMNHLFSAKFVLNKIVIHVFFSLCKKINIIAINIYVKHVLNCEIKYISII
jgi:hypothetical protein